MTENQPQQECPPPRTREAVDCWLRKWDREAAVDGTEPLTRDDVELLIEANGGTAKGLFLSEWGMQRIDLSNADLQGADLTGADLQGADLSGADLQGANLFSAKLQDAYLNEANLQSADLTGADLRGADLQSIHISRETNLEDVTWPGEYALPSEEEGDFDAIQSTYRSLKTWHQEHGFYEVAGEFHHREMVCMRKATFPGLFRFLQRRRLLQRLLRAVAALLAGVLMLLAPLLALLLFWVRPGESWVARFWDLTRLNFYEQLFGYGERPWRVVRVAVAVVPGLALAYRYFGTFVQPVRLIDALYFSAVSFSALGYGSWAPVPLGWARYMGVAESFLGVFTIALFLVTFTRKMVR